MKNIYTALLIWVFFSLNACQTIENKTQKAIKKENDRLSKFLNQPEEELKIVLGKPDKIIFDDKGSKFLVYVSKKYKITCERSFEVNEKSMVVGFASKGCF